MFLPSANPENSFILPNLDYFPEFTRIVIKTLESSTNSNYKSAKFRKFEKILSHFRHQFTSCTDVISHTTATRSSENIFLTFGKTIRLLANFIKLFLCSAHISILFWLEDSHNFQCLLISSIPACSKKIFPRESAAR